MQNIVVTDARAPSAIGEHPADEAGREGVAPLHGQDTDGPLGRLRGRLLSGDAVVAVIGLGYVGLPLLLAVADAGYGAVGIDVDDDKVVSLRERRSYISDVADVDLERLDKALLTSNVDHAALADVIVIAVPTPLHDGTPDLSIVVDAVRRVALVLRPGQLIVLESTTWPGTTEEVVVPILESSGRLSGTDFAVAYSPERVDPGSNLSLGEVPKVVGGCGETATALAALFYRCMIDNIHEVSSPRSAEMAKLIENTFRQVNIALVNELATVAPALGVDLWEALDAAATKPFGYLPFWPGPGVGGHCIAIDPSYLSWRVEQQLGFGVGFIAHARTVNNRMPAFVCGRVAELLSSRSGLALRGATVLLVGVAYKAGVNDARESPAVAVAHLLKEAGVTVAYHDPHIGSITAGGDVLHSVPLTPQNLADADCIVLLAATDDVDLDAVASAGSVVFDACGATRAKRSDNVVLL